MEELPQGVEVQLVPEFEIIATGNIKLDLSGKWQKREASDSVPPLS